ncbi:MAG: carboxymuconolactone decarboxylase family protein [Rickettsiales bacterium]|nr:carboxymuconolactone decarboxylase family protein [Rickettsiales bacterium]
MTMDMLKDRLGDYAKDTKLNIGTVLSPEGAPDLTQEQIFGIALASAYATRSAAVVEAMLAEIGEGLPQAHVQAAKAAATIMAMNNVYYRFTHLASDREFAKLPAKLRMNVIGNPGIAKLDFELYALAISSINGCGMCMDAHVHEVVKAGVSALGVQSAIRIGAVVNALAQAAVIAELEA